MFLYILSWVATGVHVIFGTLALVPLFSVKTSASIITSKIIDVCKLTAALYYLAELVEEYASYTAKVLHYLILVTIGLYLLLFLLEDIPASVIFTGIFTHIIHLSIMRTFPFFYITSPPFILGIVLFGINHYLAFSHFSTYYYPVHEVLAYFTLFVWLVPFGFFVSLSANENVLPTRAETTPLLSNNQDDFVTGYFSKKGRRYGLLTLLNYVKEEFFPSRAKKSF